MAMVLGLMLATLLPAYGQQEVDPTWYDPWGAPKTEAVQSSKPRAATHRQQTKVKAVSSTRVASKARVKQTATRPRPS
jgi:hypothetical protein